MVRIKCKQIFDKKQEDIPTAEREITVKRTDESKRIDEEVYYLIENGLSYRERSRELEKQGIKMGRERVAQRYRRVSRITNQQLVKGIMNLVISRNATVEQIKQIAELYGVNLEEVLSPNDDKVKEEGRD